MQFQELSKKRAAEREQEVSKYWNEIDLLHRSVETRKDQPPFIFYEGPPTANGRPGIHHVIARTLKDLTCRYKTMKGFKVERKGGWDTHGLPVEIEVEKQLGLTNKQEIEAYGVEKFNKKCRESVWKYEKLWREMTEKIAYLVDMDNPYVTLEDDYIESCWHILDTMNKDGAIYEGHKILPYCSRCGTGLASHEVAQGYKEIKSETVVAKFKKKDEDAYFLAWTTTPWTLPSNVALTVHPEVEYVKVEQKGEVYYLAKALADEVLGAGEYEVLETLLGKDMEYMEYEPLLDFIKPQGKAYIVTLADYVTIEDGTGIVHTAPAFGEDDYNTGRRYDLAVIQPVNDEGKFTQTPWEGNFVMDADPAIIEWLKQEGKVYKKQRMAHNYPHCWRCDTPLLYSAKPSWYIEITRVKDKMIENNNHVNWYPDFVGEKRFGNWLENLNDWAISRSRYWGTPFNMWRCKECGHTDTVGSKKEMIERAIEDIDESIELHRPYVDDVHFKCPDCGGIMEREKDVIDVWFDSGAMPFAQRHYPFEHKDDFEQYFPADFICEGIDQTRGWFYSLMAISTYMTGRAPYKSVLVNDLVLDKDGKKMSKSRGNTIDPFEVIEEYGADVIRFYSLYVSNPWVPTRFDMDGLREVESKFFRSFRNVYNFFSLYANTEEESFMDKEVPYGDRPEIDRWILSRYHNLLKMYHTEMERFELTRMVRAINEFVNEDLSNWYIRRNRRRFWTGEMTDDKRSVYQTTYEILKGISLLVAPITPFIAEEIYLVLTDEESVHLAYLPEADEAAIDEKLEEKMETVRTMVTLGRASREEAKIKVRQPLSAIVVDGKYEEMLSDLNGLLEEELNIKEVTYAKDLSTYMDYSLKPDFKAAGSVLGKKIRAFQLALNEAQPKEFLDELAKEGRITMQLDGEDVVIEREYVDVKINAKEGFNIAMEDNIFVLLDTHLNEELIQEGYAREFISKVQQLRKSNDFEVTDTITTRFVATDELAKALETHQEFIKEETLTTELLRVDALDAEETPLNDQVVQIELTNNK